MRSTLRALERRLVVERAEVAARAVVDDLVPQWQQARGEKRPRSQRLDLLPYLVKAGVHSPLAPAAMNYLERCKRDDIQPDRQRLLRMLLPPRAGIRP